MANKMYSEQYVQNIADAIRYVNGKSSETYTIQEMAAEIEAIGREEEQYDPVLENSCVNLVTHASKICDYKMTNEFAENKTLETVRLFGTRSIGDHAFMYTTFDNNDFGGKLRSLTIDMSNYEEGDTLMIGDHAFANYENQYDYNLANKRLLKLSYKFNDVTYSYLGNTDGDFSDGMAFKPFTVNSRRYDEASHMLVVDTTSYDSTNVSRIGTGSVVFDNISRKPYVFDLNAMTWSLYIPKINVNIGKLAFATCAIDWVPWIIVPSSKDGLNEMVDSMDFLIFNGYEEFVPPHIPGDSQWSDKFQADTYYDGCYPNILNDPEHPFNVFSIIPCSEINGNFAATFSRNPLYLNDSGTNYNHEDLSIGPAYTITSGSSNFTVSLSGGVTGRIHYNTRMFNLNSIFSRIRALSGETELHLPNYRMLSTYSLTRLGFEKIYLPGLITLGSYSYSSQSTHTEGNNTYSRDVASYVRSVDTLYYNPNLTELYLPTLSTINIVSLSGVSSSSPTTFQSVITQGSSNNNKLTKIVMGDGSNALEVNTVWVQNPTYSGSMSPTLTALESATNYTVLDFDAATSLTDLTLNYTGINYGVPSPSHGVGGDKAHFFPAAVNNVTHIFPILCYIGVTTTPLAENASTNTVTVDGVQYNVQNKNAIATYDGKDWIHRRSTNKWTEFGTNGDKRPVVRVPANRLAYYRENAITVFNYDCDTNLDTYLLSPYVNPFPPELFQAIEGT